MKLALCVNRWGIKKLHVPDHCTPETAESLAWAKGFRPTRIIFAANSKGLVPDILDYEFRYGEWQ